MFLRVIFIALCNISCGRNENVSNLNTNIQSQQHDAYTLYYQSICGDDLKEIQRVAHLPCIDNYSDFVQSCNKVRLLLNIHQGMIWGIQFSESEESITIKIKTSENPSDRYYMNFLKSSLQVNDFEKDMLDEVRYYLENKKSKNSDFNPLNDAYLLLSEINLPHIERWVQQIDCALSDISKPDNSKNKAVYLEFMQKNLHSMRILLDSFKNNNSSSN